MQFEVTILKSGISGIRCLFILTAVALMSLLIAYENAAAQDKNLVIHVAKLRIDPAQFETYKKILKEGVETAIRVGPGVLNLYAVSEKDNPIYITVFEVYASAAAYKTHLETPHFKKYKTATKYMIKSLELIETVPVFLGAKAKQ
jgi:4-carboxymuconolactone decarboxylase